MRGLREQFNVNFFITSQVGWQRVGWHGVAWVGWRGGGRAGLGISTRQTTVVAAAPPGYLCTVPCANSSLCLTSHATAAAGSRARCTTLGCTARRWPARFWG